MLNVSSKKIALGSLCVGLTISCLQKKRSAAGRTPVNPSETYTTPLPTPLPTPVVVVGQNPSNTNTNTNDPVLGLWRACRTVEDQPNLLTTMTKSYSVALTMNADGTARFLSTYFRNTDCTGTLDALTVQRYVNSIQANSQDPLSYDAGFKAYLLTLGTPSTANFTYTKGREISNQIFEFDLRTRDNRIFYSTIQVGNGQLRIAEPCSPLDLDVAQCQWLETFSATSRASVTIGATTYRR